MNDESPEIQMLTALVQMSIDQTDQLTTAAVKLAHVAALVDGLVQQMKSTEAATKAQMDTVVSNQERMMHILNSIHEAAGGSNSDTVTQQLESSISARLSAMKERLAGPRPEQRARGQGTSADVAKPHSRTENQAKEDRPARSAPSITPGSPSPAAARLRTQIESFPDRIREIEKTIERARDRSRDKEGPRR